MNAEFDTRVLRSGRRVPIVAFFGTKGGVGKSTIARRFAELVTLAKAGPNVLVIDADVYHRGMTIELTASTPISVRTLHDHVEADHAEGLEAVDMSGLIEVARPGSGKMYFIPASSAESEHVFRTAGSVEAAKLLTVLHAIVSRAVDQYECSCVVIDCGPIVDSYTAASAQLSDRAFVIGQNESISFHNLKDYPRQIREFYPKFSTSKMKLIINKVRGWELLAQRQLHEDVFEAIPFTLDIIDVSEGLSARNELQMLMFLDHIGQIVERVFKADNPDLIPPRLALLPPQWSELFERADRLEQAPLLRRLKLGRMLFPFGLVLTLVAGWFWLSTSKELAAAAFEARKSHLISQLKQEIDERESLPSPDLGALEAALAAAQQVLPQDVSTLSGAESAAELAGVAGITSRPTVSRGIETLWLGLAILGLVLASVGIACTLKFSDYMRAIAGLNSGGVAWVMAEMKAKKSARRIFDRLKEIAAA